MTRHTRVPASKVGLVRARPAEGIAAVLAKALQPQNNPLAQLPMEMPVNGPTRSSAAKMGLERARSVKGIA